jgi:hypothetical protein
MPLYDPTEYSRLTTDHMLNIFNAFTISILSQKLPSETTQVAATTRTQVEVTLPDNGELGRFSKFTFHGYWDTGSRIEFPQISSTNRTSQAIVTKYFESTDAANDFDGYLESLCSTPALEILKQIKKLLDTFYEQLNSK